MPANIFGGHFMSVREPAWHNLGKVLETAPDSAVEAFKIAGLDYNIHSLPIYAQLPPGMIAKQAQIVNKYALMREPTDDAPEWGHLGIVGSDYEPIQNMELAQILDDIGLPQKWPIETVGALADGGRIFASFMDGEHNVLGLESERLKLYFLVNENRDGKTALKIVFTPVRVVCQNTLTLGLSEAVTTVNISHIKGVKGRFEDGVKLMAGLDKSVQTTLQLFDKLAAFGITDKIALSVITKAYPQPIKPKRLRNAESIANSNPELSSTETFAGLDLSMAWATDTLDEVGRVWNRESARIENIRSQAFDLYKRFNDEQPKVAQTGWAVVNAVVEAEDFRDGPEGMFESALWGTRAKSKANALKAVLAEMEG